MSGSGAIRITNVTITPVAFADPPLLNSVGVHEPFALRAIIEVATDAGLDGLGETYADEQHLAALHAAARAIVGVDVYHTEEIYRRVLDIAPAETTIAAGLIGHSAAADRVFSPFEVACLDIQGKAAGRPVADLLGGAVQRGQVLLVRVRLAQAGQARVGGNLDDGAQRERLVHPHRVQQRRVGERDGRDGHVGDADASSVHGRSEFSCSACGPRTAVKL